VAILVFYFDFPLKLHGFLDDRENLSKFFWTSDGKFHNGFPMMTCRLPLAACRLPLAACRLPLAACRLPLAACRLPLSTRLRRILAAIRLRPAPRPFAVGGHSMVGGPSRPRGLLFFPSRFFDATARRALSAVCQRAVFPHPCPRPMTL